MAAAYRRANGLAAICCRYARRSSSARFVDTKRPSAIGGGLEYAHLLLEQEGTTDGFQRLTDEGRLDLTMEALVLKPEYADLFTRRNVRSLRIGSRRLGISTA